MEVATKTKSDSYLTFKIGEEEFAAHVNQVLNILEVQRITKLPDTPEYLKGVINLRGMVLPVIDARVKLGMSETQFTDKTCIVVFDLNTGTEILHVGVIVDSVEAVHDFKKDSISPPPNIGSTYNAAFISGITALDGHFIMVLDLIKLFTEGDIIKLKESKN